MVKLSRWRLAVLVPAALATAGLLWVMLVAVGGGQRDVTPEKSAWVGTRPGIPNAGSERGFSDQLGSGAAREPKVPVPGMAVDIGHAPGTGEEALRGLVVITDYEGRPVAGAVVRAGDPEERSRKPTVYEVRADSSGQADLSGLDPLKYYSVGIEAPADRLDLVHHEVRWAPASVLRLQLQRGYTFRGSVADPLGMPVAKAMVLCDGGGMVRSSTSGADGAFTFTRLPAGTYALYARRAHAKSERAEVVLPRDVSLTVTLRLPEVPQRMMRIEGWTEELSREAVFIRRIEGTGDVGGTTIRRIDDEGRVEVTGLAEDATYNVWVEPAQGKSGSCVFATGVRLRDGGVVPGPSRCGERIEGHLKNFAGLRSVGVSAKGMGIMRVGSVEADGHFVIDGLPEGTWTWYIMGAGFANQRVYSGSVEARTGDRDVDVEIRR